MPQYVDKYLLIVMMFLIVGIPIAFVSPTTGEMRDPPFFLLFWVSIAGISGIVIYNSYKSRKERRRANAKRRSKK